MPAALVLLFGTVLSLDVVHVPLGVLDHDGTASSRALTSTLASGDAFELAPPLGSEAEALAALEAGRVALVVVVPRGFGRGLARGEGPPVQLLVDGSNASQAQTAQAYARGWIGAFAAREDRRGGAPPLEARLRVLFNPELASDRFLLPGLVAMILMIAATVATTLSIVKERETGTMEQLLVSPLSAGEVLLGKALPYFAISMVAALLVLATARVAFGLETRGSVALLLGFSALFVLGAQGLGLLLSSAIRSQQVAFQASVYATMLPSLILSGFIFPIRTMPAAVQALTVVVPARYFVAAVRGIVLKGVGARELWPEAAALAAFAVATLALAALRLRGRRL
jgi:ABC-2 type transport system permease protein